MLISDKCKMLAKLKVKINYAGIKVGSCKTFILVFTVNRRHKSACHCLELSFEKKRKEKKRKEKKRKEKKRKEKKMGLSQSKLPVDIPPSAELEKPWRKFDWNQKEDLKRRLIDFSVSNPDVKFVGIMVAGQIGAGKSSFINSVNNAFQERITSGAMVNSSAGASTSFTKRLKEHSIKSGNVSLPFVFRDIMGLEPESLRGSQPDDIVNAVFGHVKEGYKFDQDQPLSHKDQQFNIDPHPSEQAFCLVYVIDAHTVQFTDDRLIEKLKLIRERISDKRKTGPLTI